MKDISLNGNDIWTLPSDFTGAFNHGTVDENSTLYDSSTDTIYIYNDYQLKIIQSDNSENEPVMSQDMLPECVGMGQPVYSDNSSNYQLIANHITMYYRKTLQVRCQKLKQIKYQI